MSARHHSMRAGTRRPLARTSLARARRHFSWRRREIELAQLKLRHREHPRGAAPRPPAARVSSWRRVDSGGCTMASRNCTHICPHKAARGLGGEPRECPFVARWSVDPLGGVQ